VDITEREGNARIYEITKLTTFEYNNLKVFIHNEEIYI